MFHNENEYKLTRLLTNILVKEFPDDIFTDEWYRLNVKELQEEEGQEMLRELMNKNMIIQLSTEIHEQKKYQITSEGKKFLSESYRRGIIGQYISAEKDNMNLDQIIEHLSSYYGVDKLDESTVQDAMKSLFEKGIIRKETLAEKFPNKIESFLEGVSEWAAPIIMNAYVCPYYYLTSKGKEMYLPKKKEEKGRKIKRLNRRYSRKEQYDVKFETYDKNGNLTDSSRVNLSGGQMTCFCWLFGIIGIAAITTALVIAWS